MNKTHVVLLVEDDPDHAALIQRGFKNLDLPITVHHARNGEAALDYLLRSGSYADLPSSSRPDLVLLDLGLPKIDGLSVLKTIRSSRRLCSIPTVVLTSSKDPDHTWQTGQFLANSLIMKPTTYEDFKQLISEIADYWLHWNHTGDAGAWCDRLTAK